MQNRGKPRKGKWRVQLLFPTSRNDNNNKGFLDCNHSIGPKLFNSRISINRQTTTTHPLNMPPPTLSNNPFESRARMNRAYRLKERRRLVRRDIRMEVWKREREKRGWIRSFILDRDIGRIHDTCLNIHRRSSLFIPAITYARRMNRSIGRIAI